MGRTSVAMRSARKGPIPRNGLEQLDGRDAAADAADLLVQALDHHAEQIDETFMGLDQEALLGPEPRPGLGVDPGAALACVEPPARQGDADAVQLGVDAAEGRGPIADQAGAMPHEGGLLALLGRLGEDLGDEIDEPHAGEELGVDGVRFVLRVGDGPQSLRMREHDVRVGAVELVKEPGPHAAGLDDDLQGLVGLEELGEPLSLGVANPSRLVEHGSFVAEDREHTVRCV
jgi:hypothetical protein